jgi:hypothetical protein
MTPATAKDSNYNMSPSPSTLKNWQNPGTLYTVEEGLNWDETKISNDAECTE